MTPSNATSSAPCLEDLLEHGDFVRNLARSLVVDVHSADDLVQETWIVAMRNPPRHGGALQGWLSSVVRNLALRSRRSFGRRANHEQLSYENRSVPTPADSVAEQSVAVELANAVDSLDPIYRDVVTMRYFDEVAPREIASRLSIPVETVRTRLKRATDRLRTRLDDGHEGDRSRWLGAVIGLAGLQDLPAPIAGATAGSAKAGATGAARSFGARSALLWSGALVALTAVSVLAILRPFSTESPEELPADMARAEAIDERPEATVRAPLAESSPPIETPPATLQESTDALRVQGLVVGATGRPIAGAAVFVSEPGLPDVPRETVLVDDNGRFLFASVDPRSWIGARADGSRSSRLRIAWDPARGSEDLELTLAGNEQFVRGFVRDRAGRAVPGASVRPVRTGRALPTWSLDGAAELAPLPAATRTDSRGWFELSGLGPGRVPLVISSPNLAPWTSNPRAQSNSAAPLEVVLEPGAEIVGQVRTVAGEVAAFATLLLECAPLEARRLVTDESGQFATAGLPNSEVTIHATHAQGSGSQVAELSAGTNRVEVELGSTRSLRGRVAPADIEQSVVVAGLGPARRADTALSLIAEGYVGSPNRWTYCDEQGAFELMGPGESDTIGLFVGPGPPRGAPHAQVMADRAVDRTESELQISLEQLAETRVVGRVTDDGGNLLENAVVLFDFEIGTEPLRSPVDGRTGRFELLDAPPGTASLYVWARGMTPRPVGSVEIAAGKTNSVPALRVARNGSVQGRVQGISGSRPWMLRLASATSRPFDATSQDPPTGFEFATDGSFKIDLLPPGDYTLLARRGASSSGLVPITVRSDEVTEVELSLTTGEPVNLELHFPPMPGIDGTVVATIRSQAGRLYREGALPWERVDSDFVPMTISLPPGSYVVTATIGPDDFELTGTFDVSSKSSAPIRVVLQ